MASTALAVLPSAVLDIALEDLAAGVHEDIGKNDGQFLREVYGNKPGDNWCALATKSWIQRAAERLGTVPPIPGSPGAKVTMDQFIDVGRWIDVAELGAILPGMVSVWDRSDGTIEHAWWGHIGVVETPAGKDGKYQSIEGNSGLGGTQVARMTRSLSDPKLLGMGWLGDLPVPATPFSPHPLRIWTWLGFFGGLVAGWAVIRRRKRR